jgi:hypothetical protein
LQRTLRTDHTINWSAYFSTLGYLTETHPFFKNPISNITSGINDYRSSYIKNYNSTFQLRLFTLDMIALNHAGWDLPPEINTSVLISMWKLAVFKKE